MFNPDRWLTGVRDERPDVQLYASLLVKHATSSGELQASRGFLRKGVPSGAGLSVGQCDSALYQLKRLGMLRVIRGGDVATRTATTYALTYPAGTAAGKRYADLTGSSHGGHHADR